MTKVRVRVIPNSDEAMVTDGDILTVRVKSKARNGEANKEMLNLLQKHFGKRVRLKSGVTSEYKTVRIQ